MNQSIPAAPAAVQGDAGASPALPFFHFSHRGREFKCFKRKADRHAPYYIKIERRGQVFKRCLESNVRDQAQRRAVEIIEDVLNDRRDELGRKKLRGAMKPVRPAEIATLGAVSAAYRAKSALFLRPKTIASNLNALRFVVRHGLGKPELDADEVDRLRVSVLTGTVVAKFEESRLREAGEDEGRRQSALVSINAWVRCARSVFTERLRKIYTRDYGLVLPDLAGFLDEELTQPARQIKEAPPQELLARTFEAARGLRERDRAAYIAFLLGACSLRRGELQRAQWDWVQWDQGCIRLPRETKSKVIRMVPVPASLLVELREWQAEASVRPEWDRAFILPGGREHSRLRADQVCRRVDAWMRGLGWDGRRYRHTFHEMRAFYLREIRRVHGLEAAGEVAGHADLRVTREHYTGALDVRAVAIELPSLTAPVVEDVREMVS